MLDSSPVSTASCAPRFPSCTATIGTRLRKCRGTVTALAGGHASVGAGVVVGSNVFNLAALLGLSAVVAGRIAFHRRVVLLAGIPAVWVAAVCLLTVAAVVPPAAGLVLAAVVLVPGIAILLLVVDDQL